MKKWLVTGLVVLALVAAGVSVRWWLRYLPFFRTNSDLIQGLSGAVQMLLLLGAGLAFVIGLWRPGKKAQRPLDQVKAAQGAQAGQGIVQGTGNSRIGGVHIDAQGDVSVLGDLAGRDITKIFVQPELPVVTALHQLPAPVADFVGRKGEINTLVHALRGGGYAAISGISGMGGIGKTELALFVADQVRDDYPDAQLFVDLLGTSPTPSDPADALASCIRAFDGVEAKLPRTVDHLMKVYLSRLSGKRALILLDNAASETQVGPLVPPSGCALLVTSRDTIILAGMKRLTLEQLLPGEASRLLLGVAQRTITAGVVEEICKLCGYLPLALRAAGSLLNTTQNLEAAEYATQLRDERKRLERIGEVGVDLSVEATFNLSYKRLPKDTARVFRGLAVFPVSFDAAAEESVCEDPEHAHLSALVKRSLVLYEDQTRRYRLHDLVRLFADAGLDNAERVAAQRRHAEHYKNVAAAAKELYMRGGEWLGKGLALFDVEWANIRAGQAWAAAHAGEHDAAAVLCSAYPDAGAYCLDLRLHPREQIRWREAALVAARHLKDRPAEAAHLGNLGLAYHPLGESRRAIEYHEQHLQIAREVGDRGGEGIALGNLGLAYHALGESRRAIEYHEQCLQIAREIGDRRGEANALGNLGLAYHALSESRRAIEYHEQHLQIAREVGDRRGEGNALGNLGLAYHALGEPHRAIEYHEQHLQIAREIGDRRGEGNALGNLGNAYRALGESRSAIEFYEQALQIAREIGDRRGEGNALWSMSLAHDKLGERARAIPLAEAALKIYEQIESPHAAMVRTQLAEWRGGAEGRRHSAEGGGR